ncbi:DUF5018 domain-containing protein [Aquimarina sp. 2201CG1-2-11]|uniref:DUF5018 domain-containing protein n=1 Tax=Aquimarina discodermiae TaxID=3231043 RepID=UPI0034626C4F
MKKTISIALIVCALFFTSCSLDNNNYEETPSDEEISLKLSSEKQIEKFVFNTNLNNGLKTIHNAVIDQKSNTITITFPPNTDISNIKPTLTISEKATITPKSEEVLDFSSPVNYIVTAEDKTTKKYIIETRIETSEESFCEIPNGDFESWRTYTQSEVNYDAPNEWTEGLVSILTRIFGKYTFFNKYDYPTGEGSALLIKRSIPGTSYNQGKSNGYIRFKCSKVPNKLTGKYKFFGSNLPDVIDTLRIAVHFSKTADTLTTSQLNTSTLPDRARYITIVEPTEDLTDFEIDVSEFIGQEIDYATIQLVLASKKITLNALNEYSSALIDDLKFE